MKTVEDKDVLEHLEEAVEDLNDAENLARRAGGASMALYHAAQAAEKYLVALAVADGRKTNPMWELGRLHEAVADLPGLDAVGADAASLAFHATPGKGSAMPGAAPEAVRSALRIRRAVLVALGVTDLPPEPEAPPAPAPAPAPAAAPAPAQGAREASDAQPPAPPPPAAPKARWDEATLEAGPPPGFEEPSLADTAAAAASSGPRVDRRPPPPSGRSEGDRRTSFVKTFLICDPCGVRIPRTRQTAGGARCPHCNRPMRPVS